MGEKLSKMYEEAGEIGQLKAQMRLALLTLMPLSKAEEEPDSEENIKKFQEALEKIKAED